MKNLKPYLPAILCAILIFLLSTVWTVSFGQGGFTATNPVNIPAGALMPVQPLAANSAAVKFDSLWNQIKFQDEGVSLGTPQIKTVNFVGAGVAATRSGNTATVTISGGSGQGNIQLQDEGSNQGAAGAATTYNVTGKGGSVGVSGTTATFNFPQLIAAAVGTGSLAANYIPYGIPQDSAFWLSLWRGGWYLRKTASTPLQNDNGLNVHWNYRWVETNDDTLYFDCAAYNRASMEFTDTDVRFRIPANYGQNYDGELFMVTFRNMSNLDSHFVHFDSTFFVDANHNPLPPLRVLAGGDKRTLVFMQEFGSDPTYWQLLNVHGDATGSGLAAAEGLTDNAGTTELGNPTSVTSTDGQFTVDRFVPLNGKNITFGDGTENAVFEINGASDKINVGGNVQLDGSSGIAGQSMVSLGGVGTPVWRFVGRAELQVCFAGSTNVLDLSNSPSQLNAVVGDISGPSTVVQLPAPNAGLVNIGDVTIKFLSISLGQSATINVTGGGSSIERNGVFVSSFTVNDTDDYKSYIFFTDGNFWYTKNP